MIACLVLIALLLSNGWSQAAEWYVSPSGSSGAAGTLAAPFSLQRAIGDGLTSPVAAGDTIHLRGGTYYPTNGALATVFTSRINGSVASPITIKPYLTERPIIQATVTNVGGLDIYGSNTWWRGVEVWNSDTDRGIYRNPGVGIWASGTKLINCVIHDCGTGIGCWDDATPSEIYGCIIYYNGYQAPGDMGRAHGIYAHARGGTQTFRDNVIFSGYGFGIHCYAEMAPEALTAFNIEGNAAFQAGVLNVPPGNWQPNYLVGGSTIPVGTASFARNAGYYASGYQDHLQLGYLTYANGSATVVSNYFGRGSSTFNHWTNLTVAANEWTGISTFFNYNPQTPTTAAWNGSAYTATFPPFQIDGGGNLTFTQWKAATGFDATGSFTTGTPTGTKVIVRPNAYEAGRANVIVYNWSLADNVSVSLAGAVTAGSAYVVRNAQNPTGASIATGTYTGVPISLPMTNLVAATPVGVATPTSTSPEFAAFIVTSTPATPSGTVLRVKNVKAGRVKR